MKSQLLLAPIQLGELGPAFVVFDTSEPASAGSDSAGELRLEWGIHQKQEMQSAHVIVCCVCVAHFGLANYAFV